MKKLILILPLLLTLIACNEQEVTSSGTNTSTSIPSSKTTSAPIISDITLNLTVTGIDKYEDSHQVIWLNCDFLGEKPNEWGSAKLTQSEQNKDNWSIQQNARKGGKRNEYGIVFPQGRARGTDLGPVPDLLRGKTDVGGAGADQSGGGEVRRDLRRAAEHRRHDRAVPGRQDAHHDLHRAHRVLHRAGGGDGLHRQPAPGAGREGDRRDHPHGKGHVLRGQRDPAGAGGGAESRPGRGEGLQGAYPAAHRKDGAHALPGDGEDPDRPHQVPGGAVYRVRHHEAGGHCLRPLHRERQGIPPELYPL